MLPKAMLEAAARRFAILGDASRLRVLHELFEVGEASVGELAAATALSQPNVSQHLARLAAGGLVAGRRDGSRVLYRITDATVAELCSLVCRGERERLERTLVELGREEVIR
jgi:DNA-binding transcriptional ArsR family regulator